MPAGMDFSKIMGDPEVMAAMQNPKMMQVRVCACVSLCCVLYERMGIGVCLVCHMGTFVCVCVCMRVCVYVYVCAGVRVSYMCVHVLHARVSE